MLNLRKFIETNFGVILVIVLLGFSVYSFCLNAPFKTMDDEYSIVNNELIKDFSHLKDIFTTSFFGGQAYYRPLVSLSFMMDYHFFGLNPFFFNLVNVGLHLCNAILVFLIFKKILKNHLLSFGGGLLFAIHPIQWEAVTNIPGRSILLSAFFVLLGFYLFLKSRSSTREIFFYVTSLMCLLGAMLSKESGVMLSILILSYLFFAEQEKRLKNDHVSYIQPVLPYLCLVGGYVMLRHALGITKTFHWNTWQEQFLGMLTFMRVSLTFVRVFIFPIDLHFDRSQALFEDFFDPALMMSGAFYVIVFIIIFTKRKNLTPIVLFLVSWFCIELFPVSQTLAAVGVQPGYIAASEHFLYLPAVAMIGCCLLFLNFLYQCLKELNFLSKKLFWGSLSIFYGVLAIVTVNQCHVARQEITMFEQTLKYDPHNTRIRRSLALAFAYAGQFEKAENHFRKVLDLEPYNAFARIGLGKALCDQGRCYEGLLEYEQVRDAEKYQSVLDENKRQTYPIIIQPYQHRLIQEPQNAHVYFSLGVIYSKAGMIDEAIDAYSRALVYDSTLKDALFNLAGLYEAKGAMDKAVFVYERMLALNGEQDHRHQYVYQRLKDLYQQSGDSTKAKFYAEKGNGGQ